MGRTLCGILPEYPEFELVAALERSGSDLIDQVVQGLNSKVIYTSSIKEAILNSDVVIDFSTPESTKTLLLELQSNPIPALICTTGLAKEAELLIENISKSVPIAVASNTSLGIFLLRNLAVTTAKILGPSFDIEITESHHKNKKDAPSGTALSLVADLQAVRAMEVVADRTRRKEARGSSEIGISTLRGGDVIGEHTVHFLGLGERIEITHRASDRTLFARGAFSLAKILLKQNPGIYNPSNLFQILEDAKT